MSLIRRLGVLLVAIALLIPSAARGDDESVEVSLVVDRCVEANPDRVDKLFRLELGTSRPKTVSREKTRVEIGCNGSLIELRVHDPVTGKSLARRIEAGPRTGRERLLALAAMELLVASWVELEATPDPVVRGADVTSDKKARSSARRVARRSLPRAPSPWTTTAVVLGGSSWAGNMSYGGGLRVLRDHTRGFGWAADLLAQSATDRPELGKVSVLTVSGSLIAHLQRQWRAVTFRAGGGARFGAVSMSGDAQGAPGVMGGDLSGFAGGPLVRAGAQLEPTRGLTVSLSVESGYHLLAVNGTVDGRDGTTVDGVWLGGRLGVGWTW